MSLQNFNFINGKKILITGNTGFKGSWLTLWLRALEAQVYGYSLKLNSNPSLFEILNLESQLELMEYGDICDYEKLKKFVLNVEPDIIFHFAAQPIVRVSYEDPINTFYTNSIGTLNLLDSVKNLEKKCIVIVITTDKVYENKEWIFPYRENDRLGGHDPYSASKVCAEEITKSYLKSFFHPDYYQTHGKKIAVARAGNVIGGGDWSQYRLLPDLVKSVILKQELILRSPNSIRPWQHVLESLSGYLKLCEFLSLNEPKEDYYAFNFGPNTNDIMTVEELANFAIEILQEGKVIIDNKMNFHETNYLSLDPSKAFRILSWSSAFSVKNAIVETINWYRHYYTDSNDIYGYSLNQILAYDALIKYHT